MRVIAGIYKSRSLKAVKSNTTRPTTDRNKENLFNMIGPYFDGGVVLDLFGGSGGLGIEAMSRGCQQLISVDHNFQAYQTIKENISNLKMENVQVWKADYKKALQKCLSMNLKFDYVFLDPPYGQGFCDEILPFLVENKLLNENAIVVVEENKSMQLPHLDQLSCRKVVNYGITTLHILDFEV